MKPKAGTEVFELIPSQKMINFMLKYSFFHKQVIQIPMSIVTHTPIDFDVLKKALNIEIERNDCMRLRFYKEHGEFYQYFLDKYVVDDVPVVTFSTEEEQQAYLTADARRPIRHLKGEDFALYSSARSTAATEYISTSPICAWMPRRSLCSSPICSESMTT